MAIGGFGQSLANYGQIVQGAEAFKQAQQKAAYEAALAQLSQVRAAEEMRQNAMAPQIASGGWRTLGQLGQGQGGGGVQNPFGGGPLQPQGGLPGVDRQPMVPPMGGAPSPGGGQALAPMSIPSRDPMVTAQPRFGGVGEGSQNPGPVPGYQNASMPAGWSKQISEQPQSPGPMPFPTQGGPQAPRGGPPGASATGQMPGQTPLSPEERQQAQAGVQNTARSLTPGFVGQMTPQDLAAAIERGNPGASEQVKFKIFEGLYPALSKQGQSQFQQLMDIVKFQALERNRGDVLGERKVEFGERQADRAEERGFRRESLDLERQRLAQSGSHAGGLEGEILRQRDAERQAQGLPPMTADEKMEALAAVKAGSRPPGRQAAAQINAIVESGNIASRAVGNLVDMGIGATSGVFMGTQTVPGAKLRDSMFRSLANTLTSEESQRVDLAFQGVGRALASIEASGRATGLVALQGASQALKPNLGDTPLVILAKYAEIRQIVDSGLESFAASPDVGKEQKALMHQVQERIHKVVPWTVLDVNELARNPSDEKVADFAKRMGTAGAADKARMPDWASGSATGPGGQKVYKDESGNWFNPDRSPYKPAQ